MILGKVIGSVWATRKHAKIAHSKLLLIRPYFWYNPIHEAGHLVAVDMVGAGSGDDVIVAVGQSARQMLGDLNAPIEAGVLGIVDRVTLERKQRRALRTLDGDVPEPWLDPS